MAEPTQSLKFPIGSRSIMILATFVFMSCAALRLARFNAQAGQEDKSWFQGLATPAAAISLRIFCNSCRRNTCRAGT